MVQYSEIFGEQAGEHWRPSPWTLEERSWTDQVNHSFSGPGEIRWIIELDYLAWRRKETKYKQCLSKCHPVSLCSSTLCRGVESYEVPDAIPLPGSENLDARFANYGLVKHFCCYFTNGQHLKDYFQNKEASTWILLLPVWTCPSLPHRFISDWKLSNSLLTSCVFTD